MTLTGSGPAFLFYMNANATAISSLVIDDQLGGFFPTADAGTIVGLSIAGVGDINDDGVPDIAVKGLDIGNLSKRGVYILFGTPDSDGDGIIDLYEHQSPIDYSVSFNVVAPSGNVPYTALATIHETLTISATQTIQFEIRSDSDYDTITVSDSLSVAGSGRIFVSGNLSVINDGHTFEFGNSFDFVIGETGIAGTIVGTFTVPSALICKKYSASSSKKQLLKLATTAMSGVPSPSKSPIGAKPIPIPV